VSEQTNEYNQDTPFEPTPGGADVPEVADDNSPERSVTPTPEEPDLPADRPMGVNSFGTTQAEERTGEGLTRKLAREEPDPAVEGVAGDDGGQAATRDAP
jgi:hypothetical protein